MYQGHLIFANKLYNVPQQFWHFENKEHPSEKLAFFPDRQDLEINESQIQFYVNDFYLIFLYLTICAS